MRNELRTTTLHARRGMSLVDTAMALAVTGIALSGLIQLQSNSNTQSKDASSAQLMTVIGQAAAQYVQSNQTGLITALYNGGIGEVYVGRVSAITPVPTSGSGGTPGMTSIQAAGFLPSSFIDRDAWGQHHVLLLKYLPVSALYPAGGIDAIVVSYGSAVRDADLGAIASKIGAQGGFYPAKRIGSAVAGSWLGSYGSWSRPVGDFGLASNAFPDGTPFTTGSSAYTLAFSSVAPNDYLNRDYNGNTLYNTMTTALYMNGGGRQPIVGAGSVDAQSIGNSDGSNVLSLTSTYTYANNVTLASNATVAWSGAGASLKADTNWIYAVAQYGVASSGYADIHNGNYILRPASDSLLNNVTSNGTVTVATSTPGYNTVIGGGNVTTSGRVEAVTEMLSPLYCGSAACNFYLAPDGNSYLSSVTTAGDVTVGGNVGVTGSLYTHGNIWTDAGVYTPGGVTAQGGLTAQGNGKPGSGGISADGGIASHAGAGTGSFGGKIFADGDIWSGSGDLYTPNKIVAGLKTPPSNGIPQASVFAYMDGSSGNVAAGHFLQVGQSGPDAVNGTLSDMASCTAVGGVGFNGGFLFMCDGQRWHQMCTKSGPGGGTSRACGAY